MRSSLVILCVLVMLAPGCTDDSPERAAGPPPPRPSDTPSGNKEQIEIYSTVIRRLVTKDHTFGGGPSPFKYVYVVNGAIRDAGDARGNHFGPAPQPFPSAVVDGIQQELVDLPPVEFVTAADDLRRGKQGMGGVKNDGVIISLGSIEHEDDELHVGNGLWCGGTCGQWLTYVLEAKQGEWKVTGTTGTTAIS